MRVYTNELDVDNDEEGNDIGDCLCKKMTYVMVVPDLTCLESAARVQPRVGLGHHVCLGYFSSLSPQSEDLT